MSEPLTLSPAWVMREYFCVKRQAAMAYFGDFPLQDPSQHFMLFCIEGANDEGRLPSQREIARNMNLSPATVTATLRVLEKLELIRRQADESDQRVNRVEITEAGRALAQECRRRMDELEESAFSGFSEEELSQLRGCFQRMTDNLRAKTRCRKEEL